jgi:phosphatidylethanolamine-binding protein (PEBP) family uncharacterized protein
MITTPRHARSNLATDVAASASASMSITSSAVVDSVLLDDFQCERKYPNPDDTRKANSYLTIWGVDPLVVEIGGTAISYTSPCSPDASGAHEYTITLYALSATPADLPAESSVTINRDALVESFEMVSVLDTTTLTFTTGGTP